MLPAAPAALPELWFLFIIKERKGLGVEENGQKCER